MPDVAVVIVNYGSADLVEAAIDSILRDGHDRRVASVEIVDNASPGDDAGRLRAMIRTRGWADVVHLQALSHNGGFGAGNNAALSALAKAESPPGYVFFLNPDARLRNDAVGLLAGVLDRRPEVAFVGAGVVDEAGASVSSAFHFPSLKGVFASAVQFGPISRIFGGGTVAIPPMADAGEVDWVTGAAVLARRQAVEALGGFDPGFFLYFEETDLMRRGRRAGWRTWCAPEAVVVHDEGGVTGLTDRRARRPSYWYASWRRYFEKTHGRGYALAAAALWCVGAGANRVVSAVLGRAPSTPSGFWGDFWSMVIRPLIGLEPRVYER